MDLEQFKKTVTKWKAREIKEQFACYLDTRELCWSNAQDYSADEEEYYRWLDEYNECNQILAVIRQEAEIRKILLPE